MRIVILGGGFGGLNTALRLGEKMRESNHEVVLIADKSNFIFRPSLLWVPFGQRKIEDISFLLAPTLDKAGVKFIQKQVSKIMPRENRIVFHDQSALDYDYAVIATGAFPDYAKIEGLRGNTSSIYFAEDALKTKLEIESLDSQKPIIIGVAQGNPSSWMSYEFLFELDAYLKQKRRNPSITYFTYEKDLLNHGGKNVTEILKTHMQEKGIAYHCDVNLQKVDEENLFFSNGVAIPYGFSLILPPYKGAEFIFSSKELNHQNGLITVNTFLQSVQWENIYVVGDANLLPNQQVIKTGRAAELQGHIAAENILLRLKGKSQTKEYEDSLLGLMELGTNGGMFVFRYPNSKSSSSIMEWAMDGTVPHLMKIAFEKYYLWKLR
ncbi:NAD(P)/FAD-dependent oxidoreductase [Ammoniphilus sp. YIM 78166]|uniref:NAD(P)/FAD-dependent oxidoreductase n=1 Tax=Ammoniphilus sp. YIM 78166 TaxID=1644106 RepID=UPI0010706286|nr:FAD-dependent oxidoreductase [Ammoniphilus sp. YIM 78166]